MNCTVGSRAQVMNGTCKKTSGGLTKGQLKYNKYGKIVSREASKKASENKNLGNFLVKKGTTGFGLRPKRGSPDYKKLKKSKRCPAGSHKSASGKSCLKNKKSKKKKSKKSKKKCPAGSRKSASGKTCRKK